MCIKGLLLRRFEARVIGVWVQLSAGICVCISFWVYGDRITHGQYACVAASWSAQVQALDVDVKQAESAEEVMRLAAPCPLDSSAFPCAAGTNTSSVYIFSENSMLDAVVVKASAGAIRALPYGIFAVLVSHSEFFKFVGGVRGEGADENGVSESSSVYHLRNKNLFTDPDLQLPVLKWPQSITDSALHSAWLAEAAVDAWLSIVPFPYILDAHAVVDARTSSSFSSNSSDATGANGRQCILASMHIDRARYFLRINDHDKFTSYAWTGIDLSSVCLFSALNLNLKTPFRDRIEQNFRHIFWNLHLFDRTPLPVMAGCKE